MALPKAIEEAGQRAEALHREHYGEKKPVTDPPAEGERNTPVIEAPKEPEQPKEKTVEPPKAEEPAEDFREKYEVLKRKHEVLTGKYNAEVPRLHSENTRLSGEVDKLRAEVEELKKTAQASVAAPKEAVDADLKKLEEEYGPEFMRTIEKRARQIADGLVKESLNPLQEKIARVESSQAGLSEDKFFSYLDEHVKDWEAVNANPEFIMWLGNREPITGESYMNLLKSAQKNLNPVSAVRIFETYKRENAQPPKAEEDAKKKELEKQITPGKSRSAQPTIPEKKTYTRGEISKFYQDVSAGVYKGKEAEALKIESDIFLAQKEGRVA